MANPRTIRGAKKRGWTVVYVPRSETRSWVGTCNWIFSNAKGHFIDEYRYVGDGDVAFEQQEDAVMAVMFLNAKLVA
jgi:hypothetical protein